MIANPVQSTCTSTTPILSERAGGDAHRPYNRCTVRLIPLSWLQEWCCKRGDYVVRGGTALSLESTAGSSEANFNGSLLRFEGEAQIVGGVFELAAE